VTVFTTNSNLDEDLDVPTDQPIDVDGVEVWYFKHEEPIKKWLPFIPYLSKSMGFLYAPAMSFQLRRVIPSVDVVHTHMPYVYPTYATGRAAIRHKKPLVYHQRGVFDPRRLKFRRVKKMLYIKAVERPIMRRATTLIALTKAEVGSYRALGVLTPCRVIPNGVDITSHKQSFNRSTTNLYGISSDELVILFMSRLHPIKGADKLLHSFLILQCAFPKAKLVMAGPDEWGMVERFRQKIMAAGLLNRVLFPGVVSGIEKQTLLARADLFCLPSDAEGFSMAILEAMASKTAVLISPGCHFPAIETFYAGKIVEPNIDSLVGALSALLADRVSLKVMGENGYRLVKAEYAWDTIVDSLVSIYRGAISTRKQ